MLSMSVSLLRRLTPDFKVRVEVRYRGRVSFPLTVRAHILSQQEKDNLPEWTPEGMMDDNLPYGKAQCQLGMNPKNILVSYTAVESIVAPHAPSLLKRMFG